jgi:hypothetical protein
MNEIYILDHGAVVDFFHAMPITFGGMYGKQIDGV